MARQGARVASLAAEELMWDARGEQSRGKAASQQPEWEPLLPLITAGGLARGLGSKQVGSDSSGAAVTSRCLR